MEFKLASNTLLKNRFKKKTNPKYFSKSIRKYHEQNYITTDEWSIHSPAAKCVGVNARLSRGHLVRVYLLI